MYCTVCNVHVCTVCTVCNVCTVCTVLYVLYFMYCMYCMYCTVCNGTSPCIVNLYNIHVGNHIQNKVHVHMYLGSNKCTLKSNLCLSKCALCRGSHLFKVSKCCSVQLYY